MQRFLKIVGNGQRTARDMTAAEAESTIKLVLDGTASPMQVAALVAALRIKEESREELAVFARVLRDYAKHVPVNAPHLVELCQPYDGRGKAFSITVPAAIVATAAGARVALHGRPGQVTPPKFGIDSGDILNCLGIHIDRPLEEAAAHLEDSRLGLAYVAVGQVAPRLEDFNQLRLDYGMRSFFNTIEKLMNPFESPAAVLGVFHGPVLRRVAGAIQDQGYSRGLAVQGPEGAIDVLTTRRTPLIEFGGPAGPELTEWTIDPTTYGWSTRVGDAESPIVSAGANAELTLRLLRDRPAELDTAQHSVILTAALILYAAGCADRYDAAIDLAYKTLESGAAYDRLTMLQNH
jgi:anthranilate phosphoribosyltransferase